MRLHADVWKSSSDLRDRKVYDHNRVKWDIDISDPAQDIIDIIGTMSGAQRSYVDLFGDVIDIGVCVDALNNVFMSDVGTEYWAQDVSELLDRPVTITYRDRVPTRIMFMSGVGSAEFVYDHVFFESGTLLEQAKHLIETGLAQKYVVDPCLEDAVHILRVSDPNDGWYDLVLLPSGGHVPTGVLKTEYGVSWETLARIPLGAPRDDHTFCCPVCGAPSFYAGVCDLCNMDDGCCAKAEACDRIRVERKAAEHGEILRLIKSGNWKQCRYVAKEQ